MLHIFHPALDLTDPHMNATLLIGGLAADREFIGAAQHHYLGKRLIQVATLSNSLQFMTLCVEQEIAGEYFEARLIEKLRYAESEHRVARMIEAAAETVRFMETRDFSIGGTIRYLILRRGVLPDAGIYQGD
jgi:hypothetical protein